MDMRDHLYRGRPRDDGELAKRWRRPVFSGWKSPLDYWASDNGDGQPHFHWIEPPRSVTFAFCIGCMNPIFERPYYEEDIPEDDRWHEDCWIADNTDPPEEGDDE